MILTVMPPTIQITITPSTLPNATQGIFYSIQLAASGGSGSPFTFTLMSVLPPLAELTLTATGLLSGTCPAAGTFTLVIQVADSAGNSATF